MGLFAHPTKMILRTFTRGLLRPNRTNLLKPVDVAVCIDIECTCDSPIQMQPMELIEIACLKLDLNKLGTNSHQNDTYLNKCPEFHSFVKPVVNPHLTLFCQELIGLLQSTVDKADPVERVMDGLLTWMQAEGLIDGQLQKICNFAFASCGNFDLSLLSPVIEKCKFNNELELPIYFQEWINVKKTFVNHKREWPKGLYHMLDLLGLEPYGRLHSAKDDCINLGKVVAGLHADGCKFSVTSRSKLHRLNIKSNRNSNDVT